MPALALAAALLIQLPANVAEKQRKMVQVLGYLAPTGILGKGSSILASAGHCCLSKSFKQNKSCQNISFMIK